jgi:tetratricopeptide (TPR) repeat protein
MSAIRNLIHEIHRRSIWQVLGIYLVAGWVVLQVVEVLTESAGLPDWTPGFAVVLLLIGLPICLATAVVQEGLPGGERGEGADARRGGDVAPEGDLGSVDAGPTAASVATSIPSRSPLDSGSATQDGSARTGVHRLLTWRNAILGGVLAFALLGVTVFGYFVMWSTGVGPVGSLVAQGVLDERDPVVLADFANTTGQDGLGDVVTEALRVDLVESPVLALVTPSQVGEVLGLMGREPDAELTAELAREIAVREGYKAVIQGEIASAGSAYVISASVVAAESGDVLKAFRETARSDDDVVDAIDQLSQNIREGTGESLRSIRAGEPLERATTASLSALQKLTAAERAEERGDYPAALALLEEAVALDPAFAMAHRKIAVLLFNQGSDGPRSREATLAAYENRDRLTERERYLTEAYYHSRITGDVDAEILAYRNALRVAPDESAALNNLALTLFDREEFEESAELLERAVGGPGESSVAYWNRVRVYLFERDTAGARAAHEEYEQRFPGHTYLGWSRSLLELQVGDSASVHAAVAAQTGDEEAVPFIRSIGWRLAAAFDVSLGRLDEARSHLQEGARFQGAVGLGSQAIQTTLSEAALVTDHLGDTTAAAALVQDALERWSFEDLTPAQRPWAAVIRALAASGGVAEAEDLFERWESELPPDGRPPDFEWDRREASAWIELGRGRVDQAIAAFEALQRDLHCERCYRGQLADLYARSEDLGRAAELWEGMFEEVDDLNTYPRDRALALSRLGPLYERLGDADRAVARYTEYASAWAEADAGLQPRVEEARARAAALTGGTP